jgi:hypothetical protein
VTSDPRAALAAALNERGPVAPLLALRHAADWAARTVLKEACADDMAAFECVVALDDALPPVRDLMRQAPELVNLASAGSAVGDRLAASAAELAREREALAAERAALESARDLLARLAEVEAERARLRDEIRRAERATLIERELPTLRRTLAELTNATAAAGTGGGGGAAEAGTVINGLIAAARRLTELTEEQRSILDADNDRLAARVADVATAAGQALARHAGLAAELETREREAAELRAAEENLLPGLRARRQADAELAEALAASQQAASQQGGGQQAGAPPGLERVRAELAELGERVNQAESLLRPLLRRHQQAYEEASKVRGPAGDPLS